MQAHLSAAAPKAAAKQSWRQPPQSWTGNIGGQISNLMGTISKEIGRPEKGQAAPTASSQSRLRGLFQRHSPNGVDASQTQEGSSSTKRSSPLSQTEGELYFESQTTIHSTAGSNVCLIMAFEQYLRQEQASFWSIFSVYLISGRCLAMVNICRLSSLVVGFRAVA